MYFFSTLRHRQKPWVYSNDDQGRVYQNCKFQYPQCRTGVLVLGCCHISHSENALFPIRGEKLYDSLSRFTLICFLSSCRDYRNCDLHSKGERMGMCFEEEENHDQNHWRLLRDSSYISLRPPNKTEKNIFLLVISRWIIINSIAGVFGSLGDGVFGQDAERIKTDSIRSLDFSAKDTQTLAVSCSE